MKPRRSLSILLALCMVLVSVPITGFSFADSSIEPSGTTTYVKKLPEYPILNAVTSDTFYDKIVANDAAYAPFNAISAFGTSYSTKQSDNRTCTYSGFASTVLNEVANADWNSLKMNYSGYFTNNHHEHRAGNTALGPTIGIKSFIKVFAGGSYGSNLYVTGGGKNLSNTKVRVGNNSFNSFVTTGDLFIKYENSEIHWENLYHKAKTDTCGGDVEKQVFCFADTERSHLKSVTFRNSSGVESKDFAGGEKVTIVMTFTEPLRFADGANHNDVYIGLCYNNEVVRGFARLTRLEGNTLTFQFTTPNDGKVHTVSGIDFFAQGLPSGVALSASSAKYILKHPYKTPGKSETILDYTSLKAEDGVNRSCSMVTDLAGNAVTFSQDIDKTGVYSHTFGYFDDEDPYIAVIDPIVVTNNSDVKAALNKTDSTDPGYTDNSDIYLGVGDRIHFKVYMNELTRSTIYAFCHSYYTNYSSTSVVFDTNLINKTTGDPYQVYAFYATDDGAPRTELGQGSSKGLVTYFLTNELYITEDMELQGERINITGVHFGDSSIEAMLADAAGNPFDSSAAMPDSTKQYMLDVAEPTITSENGATQKYTDYGQGGFFLQFTLADGEESGVVGLNGSFRWDDGRSDYEYEYAVSGNSTAPTSWLTGKMGVNNTFTQLKGDNYIHIRPKAGVLYDVSNSSIYFTINDFAGNQAKASVALGNITVDRVPPSVSYNSTSKTYAGDTGNYETVSFNAYDASGIYKAYYYWTASDTEVIAKDSTLWTEAGTVSTGVYAAPSETFAKGASLAKNILWVKAEDIYGETTVQKLGKYEYNLKNIAYTIDYSNKLTVKPDLTLTKLDDEGSLMVVMAQDFSSLAAMGNDDTKAVIYKYVSSADVSSTSMLLNASLNKQGTNDTGWLTATMTKKADNSYEFTGNSAISSDSTAAELLTRNDYAGYTGDIGVLVLSGNTGGFVIDGTLTTAGNSSYPIASETFTLHVGRMTSNVKAAFPNATMSSDVDLSKIGLYGTTMFDNSTPTVLSTLEGVRLTIDLKDPKDNNTFIFDDIDFDNAYVEISDDNSNSVRPVKSPSVIINSLAHQAIQTITLPTADYPDGYMAITVVLPRFSSYTPYTLEYDKIVYIDTTEPEAIGEVELRVDGGLVSEEYGSTHKGIGQDTSLRHDYGRFVGITKTKADSSKTFTIPVNYSSGSLYDREIFSDSYDVFLKVTGLEIPSDYTNSAKGDLTYTGEYYLRCENLTTGDICYEMVGHEGYQIGDYGDSSLYLGSVVLSVVQDTDRKLKIDPTQDNIIAISRCYINGKASSPEYYTLKFTKPISGKIHVDGEDSATDYFALDENDIIRFVPGEGCNTSSWRMYIWSYESENINDAVEMTRDIDGSWYCDTSVITTDMTQYDFFAVDTTGMVYDYPGCFRAELDRNAPDITVSTPSITDGMINTLTFKVRDNSIRSGINSPFKLSLSWNDEYCEALGIEPGSIWTLDYDFGVDKMETYDWTHSWAYQTENGIMQIGISSPFLQDGSSFNVWLDGFLLPDISGIPIQLTLTATDNYGNTGSCTADFGTPTLAKARLIDQDFYDPARWDQHLTTKFNIPVMPAESWANRNITEFSREWESSFPITKDGTYEIEYTDIFGRQYSEEVEINCIGDYGFDLYISTLDETGGDVTIIATSDDGKDFFITGETFSGMTHYTGLLDGDTNPYEWENSKTRVASYDGHYIIIRRDSETGGSVNLERAHFDGDTTHIYLNNLAKSAPEAILRFDVDEFADSYTEDQVRTMGGFTTESYVQVSYTTGRHITPTGGTTTEHIFRYGEPGSYTFTYEDDFGHTASVTVSLSDYGIVLTEPPVPYEDHDAPDVGIDVYIQRGGAVTKAEYFEPETTAADLEEKFDDIKYVQGYSFTLKVDDYSKYKVVVKNAKPTSMAYATATSDTMAGVMVSGNTIKVENTIAGDFWVCVVDNASGDSAATADNFTCFKLSKADMIDWFDNVQPESETKEIATNLYSRRVYISIADKDDAGLVTTIGHSASGPQIVENTDPATKDKYPYYMDFTENTTVPFIVRDMAGNQMTLTTTVSTIDDSKPVLSVTWSPCYVYTEQDGENGEVTKLDETKPTAVPVNTDITAHVFSDKSIDVDKVKVYYYTYDWLEQPQCDALTWNATEDVVSIHYHVTDPIFERMKVRVFAPNGKFQDIELNLAEDLIDKELYLDKTDYSVYREISVYRNDDAAMPYAMNIWARFDEPVYCLQDKKTDETGEVVLSNEITIPVTDNDAKIITIVDRAGNTKDLSIPMNYFDFDFDAPEISFVAPADGDLNALSASPTSVLYVDLKTTDRSAATTLRAECDPSLCSVAASGSESHDAVKGVYNQDWHITIKHNGTYRLVATDTTGNVSDLMLSVHNIDNVQPQIEIMKTTVKMPQGTTEDDARSMLSNNFDATDNSATASSSGISGKGVNMDDVNFNVPGTYPVIYSATDLAGNVAQAKGYVKIIDKNAPQVTIDGELAEDDGLATTNGTTHTISVSNLADAGEPYKVYIYKGQMTGAQMKYFRGNSLSIASDGSFTAGPGMYTVYIVTQSRRTFLTLLYVEQ